VVGPCSLCDARCCKSYVITTTVYDIARIAYRSARSPASFCVLHEPRLLCYDPDMVIDTEDGYGRYLLGLRSHPCVFLDEKDRCSIHLYAPLSCRSYPFQVGGGINARFCPLPSALMFRVSGPGVRTEDLRRELSMHKLLVKRWNARGGTRAEALAFLLSEAGSGP